MAILLLQVLMKYGGLTVGMQKITKLSGLAALR
jgi:hypothetical protein